MCDREVLDLKIEHPSDLMSAWRAQDSPVGLPTMYILFSHGQDNRPGIYKNRTTRRKEFLKKKYIIDSKLALHYHQVNPKQKPPFVVKVFLLVQNLIFFSFFAGSLYLLYVPFIRSAIFTFSSIFHLVCTRPYVLRHFLGYFFINFTVFVLALKKHKSRNKTKQILPDEHQLNTVHLRKSIKLKLSKPTKSSKSTEIANNHTDLYMFGVFHFHPVASRRR